MAEIRVQENSPGKFEVEVREGSSATRHSVTAAGAKATEIQAAFRFLLEREPKESILRNFDISVISRYFPEYEKEKSKYL